MSSDYYGFIAGEIADAGRDATLNEQLSALARLRRFDRVLEYAEDFGCAFRETLNDPMGRAALTMTYQQAQVDGQDHGGKQCCGTTAEWHRPWCEHGPRRYRAQGTTMTDKQHSVHWMARLLGRSLKLAAPGTVANVDTLGDSGVITLANGQQFSFEVRELRSEDSQ